MRTRIVIGAGAWVLGAAAATAGSLYVVSELGDGISASPSSQQSTAAALSQTEAGQAAARPSSSPSSPSQRGTGGKSGTGAAGGTGGAGGTNGTSGTILTSSGGTVIARCQPAGAFLQSWSPQVGFQESSVARGPATSAQVVFTSGTVTVTMVVSCTSGTPTAASTVTSASAPAPTATGDDGGGGGNKGPGGGGGKGGGGDG